MKKVGFEPTWGKLTDLQSVAFDHSATSPKLIYNINSIISKLIYNINSIISKLIYCIFKDTLVTLA